MLLKSLELQGFKTFPDKTKLEFNRGITAVVGPNGSGKSNISDAIIWVLGEQSTKNLRCGKMEDIVFDGTDNRKSKGFAKVTLTIDNNDKKLNFDENEVAVTRKYYRSGESEYLINNKTVRLREINELFMDTGLGKDGYSVIGQGKIDNIVASKSSDRREIFEEAAGISKFRYRKLDSQRQLIKTEENLVRLNDIFSELEQRVTPLKEQSQKADRFLKYSKEKKEIEIGIWVDTLNKSSRVLKEQEDKIFIVKQRETENSNEVERVRKLFEKNFVKSNSYSVEINRNQAKISETEKILAEKKNYISVYKNDIFHNSENIKRTELQISYLKEQDGISLTKLENYRNEKDKVKFDIKRINGIVEEYSQELNKLYFQINKNQQSENKLFSLIEDLTENLSDEKIDAVRLSSAVEDLRDKNKEFVTALNDNKLKLLEMEKTEKDYVSIKETINSKQQEIRELISQESNKLQNISETIQFKKSDFDKLVLSFSEKKKQAQLLEDLEKNMEGYNRSVKFIMRQAENGRIIGICAPVSKLIDVDEKYKIAIETALGMMAQHIVCENERSAKSAIIMLKKQNVGRATFLPVSVIKKRFFNSNEIKNDDGFLSMADEICKTKLKYREIIGNLLGRVAIVKDIDCALRIAKHMEYKIKLVTLDGQVINLGGSLTGGSANKTSGLLSRLSDVQKLKEEAAKCKIRADNVKKEIHTLSETINTINVVIKKNEKELSILNGDKIRIETESDALKKEIDKIKNYIRQIITEQNKAKAQIENFKSSAGNAENERKELILNIENKKKELSDVKGENIELNTKRELLREKIHEKKLQIISLQKDLQNLNEKIDELENIKSESLKKVEKQRVEIKNLSEKNQELTLRIENFSDEICSCEKIVDDLTIEIKVLREEKNQNEQNSIKLRNRERSVLKEHEEISSDLVRFKEQMDNLKQSYDAIISKLWDEYEVTKSEAQQMDIKISDMKKAKLRLSEIKIKIKSLGNVNLSAIEEYKEVYERYAFMKKQINDVEKSKKELTKQINSLTENMEKQFKEKFNEINKNFKDIFYELFSGGKANLELTDNEDVLNCGIDIKVKPPGKVVSHLELLSGGEKAMVSIVLYFSIMRVNPPPFCVLDEIEAALDDINIERFVTYLKKINDKTQFIIITHRRGTMEESDTLYGVTMQEKGISKLLKLEASEISSKLNIR